jgi:hypothetical protein
MKKIVILLFAVCALFAFSCNKYCNCKQTIDGVNDPDYKGGRFVNELGSCESDNAVAFEDGKTYEVKCK